MSVPGENGNNEKTEPTPAEEAFSNQPEAQDGEYHFKNGYSERIYADAHYVPENENTEPPKYYKPPERPVRVSVSAKKKKKEHFFLKALCLCLVCALLGGLGGAALVGRRLSTRMDALEQSLQETVQAQEQLSEKTVQPSPALSVATGGGMSLGEIYAMACEQVVGITTEVTYQNFFGQTSSAAVSGSGFVISSDGYILTNYHVIEYAHKGGYTVTVMLHDGTRYEASIVGTEESNDIAVLKIDAAGLSAATLGDSDALRVGDEVHAVGNPLGELEFSMTNGNVSALDRVITTDANSDPISMFQIDAAVNSGNSGGPVYNNRGEVVGVVTAKYSSTGVEGLGFAIPINDAARIADDLISKGYVTGKAYMGITLETSEYFQWYAQYNGLPGGACVKEVEKGSSAEKAGIQARDIITRVGDTAVTSPSELRQVLKQYSAGDTAEIELYRADKSLTVTITFDEAKPSGA